MKVIILCFLTLFIFDNKSIARISKTENENEQLYFKKSIKLKTSHVRWYYFFPFADKTYVFAIAYADDEFGEVLTGIKGENTIIYFGKDDGKNEKIFWKEISFTTPINNNVEYEDYNNDGVKDLILFMMSGARGGNAYYNLYLINPKIKSLTKVRGFEDIVNPSFNKKYRVIVSLGLAGENYYSLYRLTKENKIIEIGKLFKDTETLNLDRKISQILRKTHK